MAQLDQRLIPNHILAAAIIGVFLFAVIYVLFNFDTFVVEIPEDPTTALVVGGIGGTIITALIVIVKEVTTFYFRKTPSE